MSFVSSVGGFSQYFLVCLSDIFGNISFRQTLDCRNVARSKPQTQMLTSIILQAMLFYGGGMTN